MKLSINRREEKKGLIFKSPVYFIDVNLEVSPQEAELIKKHKWGEDIMAKGQVKNDFAIDWSVKNVIGSKSYQFNQIEWAADFEQQVVEGARKLKANLEAAAGFTASGPREVQL